MRRVLTWVGVALVVLGLATFGFVAWEYKGTNVVSHQHRDQVLSELHDAFKVRDGQTVIHSAWGDSSATIRIPRLGSTWQEPVLEGTGETQLATGVGHWTGSAEPGQRGNLVLFAHRVTHGEPFRNFPRLRAGDRVIVTTASRVYVYRLIPRDLLRVVTQDELWVTQRHPVPGARLITLGTCSELFHTGNRMVAFGRLVATR